MLMTECDVCTVPGVTVLWCPVKKLCLQACNVRCPSDGHVTLLRHRLRRFHLLPPTPPPHPTHPAPRIDLRLCAVSMSARLIRKAEERSKSKDRHEDRVEVRTRRKKTIYL